MKAPVFARSSRRQFAKDISFSVVIPLYNHAHYIEATLDSVLRQSQPPDEIIIVDDGSLDKGCDLAKAKLRNFHGAKILRQHNRGAHVAINTGIGISRGNYIAVLNSDDLFQTGKLARCRDLLIGRPDAVLLAGRIAIIDGSGEVVTTGETIEWLNRGFDFYRATGLRELSLLNENYVCTTSNMVFRRDLWQRIGGFQPLRYCHDLDFILAAFQHGSVVFDDTDEHIAYRVHATNTIKESLSDVRIELAAVLARAIAESGPSLLISNQGAYNPSAFSDFIENKALSGLLCYFLSVNSAYPSRRDLYAHALSSELRGVFTRLIRAQESN